MPHHHQIAHITLKSLDAPPIFIGRFANNSFSRAPITSHRHAFQELIWVQAGHGRHTIDGQSFALAPHTLALIAQGQVHILDEFVGLTGYCLRFTDAFLQWSAHEHQAVFISLFNNRDHRGALTVGAEDAAEIDALFCLLNAAYTREDNGTKYAILRHLLSALLLQIERINRVRLVQGEARTSAGSAHYHQFLVELEHSFATHHDVQHYARALQMTPSQLAHLLQEMTGKPTKRIIHERVLLEAKRYLQFTALPIKEIATLLGYNDPFHFSKIFKQEVGLSPHAFREQRRAG